MMWYGDMGPWASWMAVFGSLMWIGFLIVIGAIAWAVLKAVLRPPTERMDYVPRLTPLDLLKTRYARGEITREEFEQTKRDLA